MAACVYNALSAQLFALFQYDMTKQNVFNSLHGSFFFVLVIFWLLTITR